MINKGVFTTLLQEMGSFEANLKMFVHVGFFKYVCIRERVAFLFCLTEKIYRTKFSIFLSLCGDHQRKLSHQQFDGGLS